MCPIDVEAIMQRHELDDVLRRIDNIEAAHPRDTWTLEEATAFYATYAGMVRVRQGAGDVALRVSVSLVEPSRDLSDELVVWEVPGRADNFDHAGDLCGLQIASGN